MARKKDDRIPQSGPTISDVARRAGVSLTAVSFVLNEKGQRNRNVSEATRAKVLQAAGELHYQPHMMAQALRKGYSNEIAVLVDVALTPFALEFLNSCQQQAPFYGYALVLYTLQGMLEEQKQVLYRIIFARRPLGLVLIAPTFTTETVALARQMGVQHIIGVGFHALQVEHVQSLVFPSQEAGALAAQHLVSCGYRRLAIVQPDDEVQAEAFAQRLAGMRAVLAAYPERPLDILPLHLSAASARALVESAFFQEQPPTGIYAFSDEYALYLLGALSRQGIRVPEEVGIVGTDNHPLGEASWPALTSIRFDAVGLGKRLITMFHTLHQGLPLPEELTRPLVPSLIQRESTSFL